jgi:predicted AAA+ superfamily ATPase
MPDHSRSQRASPHFYRTSSGDEVDLLLVRGGQPEIAVEVKLSTAPIPSAGFYRSCDTLGVKHRYIVQPDSSIPPYQRSSATVIGASDLVRRLRDSA